MFIALALSSPVVLLLAVLGMERVERHLRVSDVAIELERFLDAAEMDIHPDEVEAFVAEGYAEALDRHARRRRRRADARSVARRLGARAARREGGQGQPRA